MCLHFLLFLFIVTTKVLFILLTMMSSMNRLNTSRSIVILYVIILSMVLSSYSRSPLKINLQISSLSHILEDASCFSGQHQVGLTPTLSLRELLTCNRLWALDPPCLLGKHTYLHFTMMSSINGLNTSRSIVILSVIILSIVLLSCS